MIGAKKTIGPTITTPATLLSVARFSNGNASTTSIDINKNQRTGGMLFDANLTVAITFTRVNRELSIRNGSYGIINNANQTLTFQNLMGIEANMTWSSTHTSGGGLNFQNTVDTDGFTLTLLTTNSTNTIDISGAIIDAGGLIKTGEGVLKLSGTNLYTGNTVASNGTLTISSAAALGATSAGTTISGDADLSLTGASISYNAEVLTLNTFGSLINTSGNNTWTGNAILSAASSIEVLTGTTLTASGVVSGSNSLTKTGAGTLTLSSNNTYTGNTTVSAGTLLVSGSERIANTSNVTVNSGVTFDLAGGNGTETVGSIAGAGTIDLNYNNTLVTNTTANTEFSGDIIGGYSAFTKQGTGDLTLSGDSSYTGITTISGGTLIAASDVALGTATFGNTIANGATLGLEGGITLTETNFNVQGTGDGGAGAIRNLSGDNTLAATLNLDGATTMSSSSGTLTTGTISVSSDLTVAGSGNVTIDGQMYGSSGVTKNGAGTLTFAGGTNSNSYSGATNVNEGTLVLSKTAGTTAISSSSSLTIGDGSGLAASAKVQLGASNQIADSTPAVTIASDGQLNLNGFDESLNQISGSGQIALGNGTFNLGVNSGSSTYSGVISGIGDFTKSGSGTVTLAGSNTYSGATTISGGVLQLDGSGQLADATAVTVASGSTFDLNGVSDTVGSIAGAGGITLGGGTLTSGGNNSSTLFSGLISESGGFVKAGAGNLTLSGANTYSGSTTVSAGTLQIGNGGTSGLVSGNINNNSAVVFDRSDSSTYTGVVSGTGTFEQAGSGTTVLTGTNTYTGDTTISAGTLQIGNGGTSGSVAGDITNNDALRYSRSDTLTQSGVISGSGSLEQAGAGNTIFTGTNTYSGGTTITAGTLQFGNGGTTGSITGNVTNDAALRYNRSNNFTFTGDISGAGTVTTDAGQLTLSGTNSYSGNTIVNSGSTLVLAADDALGSGGTTTVNSGGTLALQGNIRDANQTLVTIGGTGNGGVGAIQNSSGVNTLSADVDLSADTTITANAGTLNFGLQSAGDSPYLSKSIDLGSHTLTVDSDSGATVAFRYDITGTGGITKTGEGDLLLNNGWNTYTGDTNINDGKFILSPYTYSASFPSNYGLTSDVIVGDDIGAANSATFQMGDGVESDPAEYIRDTQNITVNSDGYWNLQGFKETIANLTINGGTIDAQESGGALNERLDVTGVITASVGSGSATSTINGLIGMNNDTAKSIVVNTGATLDIEANLSNGGFLKTGDGILELSGGNSFTGVAQIDAGIVRVNNNNGLGAVGTGAVGTGVIVNSTYGQLRLENVSIGAEALSLTGDGVSGGGGLRSESGTNSWAGALTLTGNAEIETASGSSLLISGGISGGGSTLTVEAIGDTTFTGINSFGTLDKTGAGTLTVTNTNAYGTANISAGNFTLGANNILSDSMDVNVTGTGNFNVNTRTETVRDINGNGTVTVDSGGNLVIDNLGNTGTGFQGTLDIDGTMTLNGGLISGGSGAGSTGEMILTAGNTLEIASNYTFGTVGTMGGGDQLGTLTLADNATLLISGNSTINIGTLHIDGDSILDFTGGVGNDNTLNLGSLTFEAGASLTVNGWNSYGDLWTSQNFPGATLDIRDADTAKITFNGFTNDQTIWLTSDFGSKEITVPEPSSYGALFMAFILASWSLRRRPRLLS